MSGAPHIELNKPDLPDLDPSAPSNAADVYPNGHTAAAREDPKASLLSCRVRPSGHGPPWLPSLAHAPAHS